MSELEMNLRDELGLELDSYNQPARYRKYHALGRLLVNLLFLKPGTYPSQPDMGINIEQYKFEFIDNQTLGKIELKIKEQMNTYLADTSPIDLKVQMLSDDENRKILALAVTVSSTHEDVETLKLYLTQDSQRNEVTAKFVI